MKLEILLISTWKDPLFRSRHLLNLLIDRFCKNDEDSRMLFKSICEFGNQCG